MAIDSFEPASLSIRALFNNDDALYSIPSYQRPYRWADEHISELWEDLENAYESPDEDYFLGSIITAKRPGARYVDVIDGQQRLTTLVILFSVIRDLYPNLNQKSENPLAIKIPYLKKSIVADEGDRVRIDRLRPDDHAASNFHLIVTNNGATQETITSPETTKPSGAELKGDDPKYNFINSVLFFTDKMSALGLEKSEKFVNFIFNRVKAIQIKCDGINSAVTLFQVLNARGLNLRPSDLIKAFLIGEIHSIYKDIPDVLEKQENLLLTGWRKVESDIANHDDMTMDDMLSFYIYYSLEETPGKNSYKKFWKCYEHFPGPNKPNGILSDIESFSANYKTLMEQKDRALYALRLTDWDMLWGCILLTARHTGYSDIARLTKVLRCYYYLCWIAGKNFATVKAPSSEVIKMVKNKKLVKDIDSYLLERLHEKQNSILKAAKTSIESSSIDKERWVKPLLLMMEYNSTDDSKLSFIEKDNKLHLEHVLPERYDGKKGWEHITPKIAFQYLKSVGNLTLLSGTKNIAASNKPFAEKIEYYRGKGCYNTEDGKSTAFETTRSIMNKEYGKQWNEKAMKSRQAWFLEQVSSILGVDLTKY